MTLKEIFLSHNDRFSCRFPHEMEIYDSYFSKYIGKEVTLLEVGIGGGGGLQVWKKYFGNKARIFGIDKRADLAFEEDQIKVFTGLQADRPFLKNVGEQIGNIDILIDDGGHAPTEQIPTFEELSPFINSGGIYACEDLHVALHPDYIQDSYIVYINRKVEDVLVRLNPEYSIHMYPSLCIMVKDKREKSMASPVTVGSVHPNYA